MYQHIGTKKEMLFLELSKIYLPVFNVMFAIVFLVGLFLFYGNKSSWQSYGLAVDLGLLTFSSAFMAIGLVGALIGVSLMYLLRARNFVSEETLRNIANDPNLLTRTIDAIEKKAIERIKADTNITWNDISKVLTREQHFTFFQMLQFSTQQQSKDISQLQKIFRRRYG